jgi:hypothetical protein
VIQNIEIGFVVRKEAFYSDCGAGALVKFGGIVPIDGMRNHGWLEEWISAGTSRGSYSIGESAIGLVHKAEELVAPFPRFFSCKMYTRNFSHMKGDCR